MLRSYKGVVPRLGQRVYVDASAQVIGDVELGDHSSVWMNAVVRGDVHSIRIGPHTNIQDNCVVHVFKALHPTVLADHVTVGHSVTLHGCVIRDRCIIGMGSTILDNAEIGERCIVGAGALVTPGTRIPAGTLAVGAPARPKRDLTADELEWVDFSAQHYVELARKYNTFVLEE